MTYLNIAGYQFAELPLSDLFSLREILKEKTISQEAKGTIILSTEGINIFLAGQPEKIRYLQQFITQQLIFKDIIFRESYSDFMPFKQIRVRIKPEIITMGRDEIKPALRRAPYLKPKQLKSWYEQKKDIIVLDTRNDYEVKYGSFKDSVQLNINHFKYFAEAVKQLPENMKHKIIVTFCTGGIRCEKAASYLQDQGFQEVYQLEGGILNYFEECGGDFYNGECFVFDSRISVNTNLEETATTHCKQCQMPFTISAESSSSCTYCSGPLREKLGESS